MIREFVSECGVQGGAGFERRISCVPRISRMVRPARKRHSGIEPPGDPMNGVGGDSEGAAAGTETRLGRHENAVQKETRRSGFPVASDSVLF